MKRALIFIIFVGLISSIEAENSYEDVASELNIALKKRKIYRFKGKKIARLKIARTDLTLFQQYKLNTSLCQEYIGNLNSILPSVMQKFAECQRFKQVWFKEWSLFAVSAALYFNRIVSRSWKYPEPFEQKCIKQELVTGLLRSIQTILWALCCNHDP